MVRKGQPVQYDLSLARKPHKHFAMICLCRNSLHEPVFGQPVYKLNGAVMANQHSRRELANSRLNAIRQALDGQ